MKIKATASEMELEMQGVSELMARTLRGDSKCWWDFLKQFPSLTHVTLDEVGTMN